MVWFCVLGSFSFGFYSYRRELTVAFFVCDQKLNLLGKQKIEIDNKQMEKPSNSRAEYWVHCEIDSERWLMKHYSKRREEIVWLWEDWLTIPIRSPYVCMCVCMCFGKRVLISWLKAEEFKQGRVCAATLTFYCHEKTSERSFSFTHDDPPFPVSPNDKVWAMWWNVTLGWTHGVGPRWTTKVTIGHVIRYESRGPKKGNHRKVQLRIYIYIYNPPQSGAAL